MAGALPQTALGKLTALPQTIAGFKGRGAEGKRRTGEERGKGGENRRGEREGLPPLVWRSGYAPGLH